MFLKSQFRQPLSNINCEDRSSEAQNQALQHIHSERIELAFMWDYWTAAISEVFHELPLFLCNKGALFLFCQNQCCNTLKTVQEQCGLFPKKKTTGSWTPSGTAAPPYLFLNNTCVEKSWEISHEKCQALDIQRYVSHTHAGHRVPNMSRRG